MTTTNRFLDVLLGAVLVSLLVIAGYGFFHNPKQAKADSVQGDYATTTDSTFASGTVTRQLKNGSTSILGNIIVGSTSPNTTYPQITVYDASSTMATTTAKVLARIGGGNQTAATYQYSAAATYGLKLEVAPGYAGNATITWR